MYHLYIRAPQGAHYLAAIFRSSSQALELKSRHAGAYVVETDQDGHKVAEFGRVPPELAALALMNGASSEAQRLKPFLAVSRNSIQPEPLHLCIDRAEKERRILRLSDEKTEKTGQVVRPITARPKPNNPIEQGRLARLEKNRF